MGAYFSVHDSQVFGYKNLSDAIFNCMRKYLRAHVGVNNDL